MSVVFACNRNPGHMTDPVTDKQRRLIKKMEESGLPEFEGTTKGSAMEYIDTWMNRFNTATNKQIKFIHQMEGMGCPKFEGHTKKEASEYITENMKFYNEQKEFLS